MVEHPCGQEGAAPADDIRDAPLRLQHVQGGPGQAAVNRHEIHSLFRLPLDHLEYLFRREMDQSPLLVHGFHNRLVNGNRSHRNRGMGHDGLQGGGDISARGEVHHRVRPGRHGNPELFQLLVKNGVVRRRPDIGVDLDQQAFPDPAGHQSPVSRVGRDDDFPLRDLPGEPRYVHAFLFGHGFHFRRDDAGSCLVHLGHA